MYLLDVANFKAVNYTGIFRVKPVFVVFITLHSIYFDMLKAAFCVKFSIFLPFLSDFFCGMQPGGLKFSQFICRNAGLHEISSNLCP